MDILSDPLDDVEEEPEEEPEEVELNEAEIEWDELPSAPSEEEEITYSSVREEETSESEGEAAAALLQMRPKRETSTEVLDGFEIRASEGIMNPPEIKEGSTGELYRVESIDNERKPGGKKARMTIQYDCDTAEHFHKYKKTKVMMLDIGDVVQVMWDPEWSEAYTGIVVKKWVGVQGCPHALVLFLEDGASAEVHDGYPGSERWPVRVVSREDVLTKFNILDWRMVFWTSYQNKTGFKGLYKKDNLYEVRHTPMDGEGSRRLGSHTDFVQACLIYTNAVGLPTKEWRENEVRARLHRKTWSKDEVGGKKQAAKERKAHSKKGMVHSGFVKKRSGPHWKDDGETPGDKDYYSKAKPVGKSQATLRGELAGFGGRPRSSVSYADTPDFWDDDSADEGKTKKQKLQKPGFDSRPERNLNVKTEYQGVKLHLSDFSASGYKGVSPTRYNKWQVGYRGTYLGNYDLPEEAALRYARFAAGRLAGYQPKAGLKKRGGKKAAAAAAAAAASAALATAAAAASAAPAVPAVPAQLSSVDTTLALHHFQSPMAEDGPTDNLKTLTNKIKEELNLDPLLKPGKAIEEGLELLGLDAAGTLFDRAHAILARI